MRPKEQVNSCYIFNCKNNKYHINLKKVLLSVKTPATPTPTPTPLLLPVDGGERLRQVVEHRPGRDRERVWTQLDHSSVVSLLRWQRQRWRSAKFRDGHQMAFNPLLHCFYSVSPGELDHRHFPFQVKGVVRGSFLGNAVDDDADAGPVARVLQRNVIRLFISLKAPSPLLLLLPLLPLWLLVLLASVLSGDDGRARSLSRTGLCVRASRTKLRLPFFHHFYAVTFWSPTRPKQNYHD